MNTDSVEQPIPTMIFELGGSTGSLLIPRLPEGPDGTLEADGIKFLTAQQCATRFGGTEQTWRDQWISVWGNYLTNPVGAGLDGGAAPASSDQCASISAAAAAAGWDVVRVVRFPHLNNAQWAMLCRECMRRRIDPMDIWVILQKNDETDQIEPTIVTTIKVFRMIGERTGMRDGESAPHFCGSDGVWTDGPWVKNEPPMAARVYVTRRDREEAFEGVAYWKFCCRFTRDAKDRVVLTDCWERGGPHMLGKCASAAGHRLAFAEELGGLYTSDELTIPRRRDRTPEVEAAADEPARTAGDVASVVAAPEPKPQSLMPDDPRLAHELIDDSTPDLNRLPMELVFNGPCSSVKEGMEFITRCSRIWPRLYRGHPQAFAAAVMKLARDEAVQAA